ncbi:hypothetical protein CAPTEDRAFT_222227 [Capitella teleta]|uniref:SUEL-type lectin domain-containing protein n=1 Tax=Capitella teleta TaxID=283909 RepID=R7UCK4_CAPTE|nr:hypothetical protein CAPTEDRAFT_222227 [Capitella teleta]|eukprot:ELU03729.1 hypothetical protein CAPTEDRAFT_222227 [Capitella teleta]
MADVPLPFFLPCAPRSYARGFRPQSSALVANSFGSLQALLAGGFTDAKEYCQLESFNATCPPHEAIFMKYAQYGRIRRGPCLTRDYYVGCMANVLRDMDLRCSGRAHCLVNIPDPKLFERQPCPKDLVAYLDAEYTCVAGALGSNRICQRNQYLNLSAPEGFLTSLAAHSTGAGSRKCPWIITALPGQRINITLHDFNGVVPTSDSQSRRCILLASVRELGSHKAGKDQPICSVWERERTVYTSQSNQLMVTLQTAFPDDIMGMVSRDGGLFPAFFLKYQDSHYLIRNHHIDSEHNSLKFPNGLWIAVIIGVALGVMLGFCLLVLVYILRKRRRNQKGTGMLREANALLSETKPDVADINKADHVTYACRFHPNDPDGSHTLPPDVGDNCSIPGNIQMTILHNTAGRTALRGGQLYEKPSSPLAKDGSLRGARFSTFKHGASSSRPADTHSLSSNCDYDRTITSIACPHNFVHYGDPSMLRQQHQIQHQQQQQQQQQQQPELHTCVNNNNNDGTNP